MLIFFIKASFTISFTKKAPVSGKKFQTELTSELEKYKKNVESEFKNKNADWVKSELPSTKTSYGEIREEPMTVKKRYLNQLYGTKTAKEEWDKVNQIENIEKNEDNLNYLRLFVGCLILGIILLSLGIIFLCLDILFKLALVITIIGSILPLIYVIAMALFANVF